jgi:pimeloyl-ACP methyl ester carboxylesterase
MSKQNQSAFLRFEPIDDGAAMLTSSGITLLCLFMAHIALNGASIYYQICGEAAETIVFAHGLLLSERIFTDQVAALQYRYRCLTFDFRGHGRTSASRPGYDVETLYADTVGVIQELRASPCHFVGLSLGGIIGLHIALRRPELLRSLALFSTTADAETSHNKRLYRFLTLLALLFGPRLVANQAMPVMFGRTFLNDPARSDLKRQWRQHLIANPRLRVVRAVNALISRQPIYEQISQITTRTLIAVGEEDPAATKGEAARIHSQIKGSVLVRIPRSGHLITVEVPETVKRLLETFVTRGRL